MLPLCSSPFITVTVSVTDRNIIVGCVVFYWPHESSLRFMSSNREVFTGLVAALLPNCDDANFFWESWKYLTSFTSCGNVTQYPLDAKPPS